MQRPVWIRGFFVLFLALALGLATACDDVAPAPEQGDAESSAEDAEEKARVEAWTQRLKEIAGEYPMYGAVDDESRWAPFLCRMPNPSAARLSAAEEKTPHARKLYTLFAADRSAYVEHGHIAEESETAKAQPIGQVLVKEAHVPVEIDAAEAGRVTKQGRWPRGDLRWRALSRDAATRLAEEAEDEGRGPYRGIPNVRVHEGVTQVGSREAPVVQAGEKFYKSGEDAGLFIMFKVAADVPGTDAGWVYGTLDRAGKVTGIGRMQACMQCHKGADHDRLFGLPSDGR